MPATVQEDVTPPRIGKPGRMSTVPNTPAAPAPRWAVRAAHAAALTTVPSGLWRIALALGLPVGYSD
ncbi:hypothetical protein GCM10020000_14080 [Streptomyces olivoverticillatus]